MARPRHTCQVGKVQKREISLFSSCQRGRFCEKPIRAINFVYQHSNSGWNFENDEIFTPYNGLKLMIWCITFYYCTFWTLCWLSNAFSLQNSIQFTLFNEKMIGWWWGPKRGRFPLLVGRWMFRREMGSKRGSLPPKEESLTCMPRFERRTPCSASQELYHFTTAPSETVWTRNVRWCFVIVIRNRRWKLRFYIIESLVRAHHKLSGVILKIRLKKTRLHNSDIGPNVNIEMVHW